MKTERAASLIELILLIAIVAAAIPPLLVTFGELSGRDESVVPLAIAQQLATRAMEREVMGKTFATVGTIGVTAFPAPFANYRYQVTVNYVAAANFTVAVDPTVTNYKRARVTITNVQIPTLSVSDETVFTNISGG